MESLNNDIYPDMDISKPSLSDLRILHNAFAARQGYCFTDYALRAVFNRTSWYDILLLCRLDGGLYGTPITYTLRETAFIDRVKARENELRGRNFTRREGER